MRFLFVGQGYPGVKGCHSGSGIGTYLREMTLGLIDGGHRCHVLVWGDGGSPQEVNGVAVHALSHSYWPILERFWPDYRDAFNLARTVRSLHEMHAYDWIEIQSEEGIGIGIQRDWPGRTILRVHTTLAQMARHKRIAETRRVSYRLKRERESFLVARHVVTHSRLHAEELLRDVPGIVTPAVVEHGIDMDSEVVADAAGDETGKKVSRQDAEPVFLVVGTCDMRKGFDRIADIARAYAENHGPCEIVLVAECGEDQKQNLGLSSAPEGVTFTWRPNLTAEDIRHEYRRASALLHPARYESFGIPLIEAAGMHLPIVCTDVGVARDLLRGNLRRFIVDGNDCGSFAAALHDAVLDRARVGEEVHSLYEARFTRKRMVQDYLEYVASIQ